MLSLVGDIGGTNSRFALARDGHVLDASQRSYRNDGFETPVAAVQAFLQEMDAQVHAVCLGVAGPVQGDAVRLTNYPWSVEAAQIAQATGAGFVTLMNDLQAQGYALHSLGGADVKTLLEGADAGPEASRLIIAVGTGVNAAIAFADGGRVFVPPSESGHMALPLIDDTDFAIAAMIREELGHCPVEAALSGAGLTRLWRFFGGADCAFAEDVFAACAEGDQTAEAAVRRQAAYLARYAADLALVHLPMGGVFIAGSVGLALSRHFTEAGFASMFHRPGPYEAIHRAIPIHAVPQVQLTLRGCAIRLRQDLS